MNIGDSYENPKEGKTYISPSLPSFGDSDRKVRIASKVIDQPDSYAFGTVKDEIVLRHKENARTYITAKFLEDDRRIFVLSIQGYTVATDKPHNASFAFVGSEIEKLLEFVQNIHTYQFKTSGRVNISDDVLRSIVLSEIQARLLFHENQEVLTEALRSEVTKEDIVAIGYRKKQIEVFSGLLNNTEYFDDLKKKKEATDESLWQKFFEKNPWIFGFGLDYVFLSNLDDKKLEQVVSGFDIVNHGKRVDALMKTKGIISTLCFLEIKHHKTSLLDSKPYRTGCWAPSKELSGAVAQVQGTVHAGVENLKEKISIVNHEGNPTGEEVFAYQPKSYLVIGHLNEFMTPSGVNVEKMRSFELYRKNVLSPEIITFDELFERAAFIVSRNEKK